MCCSLEEKFVEASEMMELATTIDSDNIIAWTMRGETSKSSNMLAYTIILKVYVMNYQTIHCIETCATRQLTNSRLVMKIKLTLHPHLPQSKNSKQRSSWVNLRKLHHRNQQYPLKVHVMEETFYVCMILYRDSGNCRKTIFRCSSSSSSCRHSSF